MEKKEISDKIRQGTEQFKVPDSLRPDEIEKKLEHAKQQHRFSKHSRRTLIAACAAFVFLVCVGAATINLSRTFYAGDSIESKFSDAGNSASQIPEDTDIHQARHHYTAFVSDYDELCKQVNSYNKQFEYEFNAVLEGTTEEDSAGTGINIRNSTQKQQQPVSKSSNADSASASSDSLSNSKSNTDFSETDTQVSGVMEGDIVKTNGTHIFAVKDSLTGFQVMIYEVNGENVKKAGNITIERNSCEEMYVDSTTLTLIGNDFSSENGRTNIYLYDISDAKSPKKICHHTQDGTFQTSRLTDGFLYTFSLFSVYRDNYKPEKPEEFTPQIDNSSMSASDILQLTKGSTNSYVVMTSLLLEDSDNFCSSGAVLGGSDVYYMSNDNFYLVNKSYDYEDTKNNAFNPQTTIIKYSYNMGNFEYIADTAIRGEIEDSYYMHEYNKNFIFVYTSYKKSGTTTNGLGIMDEELNLTGQLENLGNDETIYSSYYIDNMAYFVTYRETDPVFAVDISDSQKPKLMSKLKLPGFSSYLHSFGDNILLGIGEGEKDNVKFSLFSISEDKKIKEIAKKELSEGSYSIASGNHRAVFVDEERKLIGLCVTRYKKDEHVDENGDYFSDWKEITEYVVYSYHDAKLKQVLAQRIKNDDMGITRGLRIGEYFYVVNAETGVKVFDINTWKKLA